MASSVRIEQLSATMAICMAETMEQGGKLIRHAGGYWSWPNCPRGHDGLPVTRFGTKTVEALVARKEMTYVEWRDGRIGRFPIAAQVNQEFNAGIAQARASGVPPEGEGETPSPRSTQGGVHA